MITVYLPHFLWVMPLLLVITAANMGAGYWFWKALTTKGERWYALLAVYAWTITFLVLLLGDYYWLPMAFPS